MGQTQILGAIVFALACIGAARVVVVTFRGVKRALVGAARAMIEADQRRVPVATVLPPASGLGKEQVAEWIAEALKAERKRASKEDKVTAN